MTDRIPADTVTHKLHITVSSVDDEPDTYVSVHFDPPLTGEEIEQLGYKPASYIFLDKYVMPMFEQAYADDEDNDAPTPARH